MKKKITVLSFAFCCLLSIGFNSCNNKPATENVATETDSTSEENPMQDGQGYTDPSPETKIDTGAIQNDGFVFIELSGKAIDGATYVVRSGDRTVAQGTTKGGGKFIADLQKGQTYQITASAKGYKDQSKTITCNGEPIKVGFK